MSSIVDIIVSLFRIYQQDWIANLKCISVLGACLGSISTHFRKLIEVWLFQPESKNERLANGEPFVF
jgi:hypothetical protein